MFQLRWLQALHSLGLEFLLSLPLLGLAFWVGGGLITDHVLSRFYSSANHLQADKKLRVQRARTVLLINAEINKRQGFSRVKVKTGNSALKELNFEFPATKPAQIEVAVSQELGLSTDYVRQLIRYQIIE